MHHAYEILFEDNHLLGVSKSAGILVQGDITGDVPLSELLKSFIKEKYNKPGEVFLGVIHRLDRPVTGVVVFAKTSKALERMNKLFREKETAKTYWAIVNSRPPQTQGTLVHWLLKDERKNKTTAFKIDTPGALKSELTYKLLGEEAGKFLLEVKPLTGRPHQIRVQLATMGCVIRGDVKYGDRLANEDASICLHSRKLEFIHPVKKEPISIIAKLPASPEWQRFRNYDTNFT